MKTYAIFILIVSVLGYVLFHYIEKVGALELENNILIASEKEKEKHIRELGIAYANLNVKYSELEKGHEQIQRFENADLSKIDINSFIDDWNTGTIRVLKDFEHKTKRFYDAANSPASSRPSTLTDTKLAPNIK